MSKNKDLGADNSATPESSNDLEAFGVKLSNLTGGYNGSEDGMESEYSTEDSNADSDDELTPSIFSGCKGFKCDIAGLWVPNYVDTESMKEDFEKQGLPTPINGTGVILASEIMKMKDYPKDKRRYLKWVLLAIMIVSKIMQ